MASFTEVFTIADHKIRLVFADTSRNSMALIPSFEPFKAADTTGPYLFTLTVDDQLKPIPKEQRDRVRDFDTGNGNTIVDQVVGGGYQYIIKNLRGEACCLLQCNEDFTECRCALNGYHNMRCFGLNNALMMVYAYASSFHDTLMIHASLVRHNGKGYPFIAKSGTGKSTQVSNWLRYIPNCDLMNDDNPIVRVIDGETFIYGTPWSGKTPCYRNVKAPLGAITQIKRADKNYVERHQGVAAFAAFMPSCASMKWDEAIYQRTNDTIIKIVESIPIYTLHCLPNRASAEICQQTITK